MSRSAFTVFALGAIFGLLFVTIASPNPKLPTTGFAGHLSVKLTDALKLNRPKIRLPKVDLTAAAGAPSVTPGALGREQLIQLKLHDPELYLRLLSARQVPPGQADHFSVEERREAVTAKIAALVAERLAHKNR